VPPLVSTVSLVAPLAFGDEVEVEATGSKGGIELLCEAPGVPVGSSNLAWRAAEAYRERFGVEEGVRLRIAKRIPAGAGLGGGSSNAAAALLAMHQAFEASSLGELEDVAAGIGSDCPLFLRREAVVMRGRGERLEPLPDEALKRLEGQEIALFKPRLSVSTKWVYSALAKLECGYEDSKLAEERLRRWIDGELATEGLLANTLERVVDRKVPALSLMREEIRADMKLACLMSGSGSCCFALGEVGESGELRRKVEANWGKHSFFEVTRIVW